MLTNLNDLDRHIFQADFFFWLNENFCWYNKSSFKLLHEIQKCDAAQRIGMGGARALLYCTDSGGVDILSEANKIPIYRYRYRYSHMQIHKPAHNTQHCLPHAHAHAFQRCFHKARSIDVLRRRHKKLFENHVQT